MKSTQKRKRGGECYWNGAQDCAEEARKLLRETLPEIATESAAEEFKRVLLLTMEKSKGTDPNG